MPNKTNTGLTGFLKTIWQAIVDYRRSLLMTIGIILGAVVVINGSYYFISAKPEACLVCHYMKPYYDQWRSSAHNSVTCIECHPGRRTLIDSYLLRYLTASYTNRPQANVETTSCLKCHSEETLKGSITYRRGIKFDHQFHLGQLRRGKNLRCTSCHATGMPDAHLSVDTEACFLCHFKDAEQGRSFTPCNVCHGVPEGKVKHQGFEFDHSAYAVGDNCSACHTSVVRGSGRVPDSKCYECHVERMDAKQDLAALHRIHITEHGVDCFRCHERIDHGKIEMAQPFTLECTKCHQPQHGTNAEMYIGTGGEGVPNTPSAMFLSRLSCEACHNGTNGASANWAEKKASCVKCHGAGFDNMLDDWKFQLDRLATQTALIQAATAKRAQSLSANRQVEQEEARKAQVNTDLLVKGRPVHNPFYAINLARQIVAAADTVARAVGAGRVERPTILARQDGACRMCHKHMPFPAVLDFERMKFPHGLHADDLELNCTKCHSSEKHRERVITKSECMQCHHQEAQISCSHCHFEQNALYSGDFPDFGFKGRPDKMSVAGIACKDCHTSLNGKPARQIVREQCITCHDDTYGKTLDRWIAEGETQVSALRTRIDGLTSVGAPAGTDSIAFNKGLSQARKLTESLTKAHAPHNMALFNAGIAKIEAILDGIATVKTAAAPK